MGVITEVLMLLTVTVFTWTAGGWALFKLANPVAGWILAIAMLIVQSAALIQICTIQVQ